MSRTFKTQRAYKLHKSTFDEYTLGSPRAHAINAASRGAATRYGNDRKSHAKLKVKLRRIQRRQTNRFDRDTE
jgi:hypothetical protein